jgi:hypothetical protein
MVGDGIGKLDQISLVAKNGFQLGAVKGRAATLQYKEESKSHQGNDAPCQGFLGR